MKNMEKITCQKNRKAILTSFIIFLMVVGYLAIVTNTATAATEIAQFGITWTFNKNLSTDGAAGTYQYGQFVNGDYWVVGPVTIIGINPPSTDIGGRIMNGSMINPSPTNYNQGYDNAMYANTYSSSLNKAFNVSPGSPLVLPSGSSLVSTISLPTASARPQLKGASILTVLSSAPAVGSFRPPYSGTNKTIKFNKSGLSYSPLKSLAAVTGTPVLADVERQFERPWIDHQGSWVGRYQHPADNMPDYGQYMSTQIGDAVLMLNLNFTNTQKEKLLIRLVQLGIDFYGIAQAGGSWSADGGHGMGRLLPIQLVGLVLGDADMLAAAELTNPNVVESAAFSPQLPKVIFQELQNTFYVDALSVSITQNNTPVAWAPDNDGDGVTERTPLPYTTKDIGLPEFGIRHLELPQRDNRNFDTISTYRSINGAASTSHALAALILGIKADWKHNVFFDYIDRWFTLTDGYQAYQSIGPFCHNMWDTYRANYGPIWPSAPNEVNDLFASIGNKVVNAGSKLTFHVDVNGPNTKIFIQDYNLPSEPNFINYIFSWTPEYNDAGIYEATFVAQNSLYEESETISITVNNVNRAPVLPAIGDKSVNENALLSFFLSATDADGDAITYSATGLPSGATFTGQTFNWTPNYGQAGTYQVTFTASDGQAQDSQIVNITVSPLGSGIISTATWQNIAFSVQNSIFTASFDATPNAAGIDGLICLSAATSTTYNNFAVLVRFSTAGNIDVRNGSGYAADTTLAYTPGKKYHFRISVNVPTHTYTVYVTPEGAAEICLAANYAFRTEQNTVTSLANLGIISSIGSYRLDNFTIITNNPPVLAAISDKSVNENSLLSFTVSATDADNDTITYSATGLPSGATFTGQTFSWTPNQSGTYQVIFTASDGLAETSQTVNLTVNNVNRAPVLAAISDKSVNEGSLLSFQVSATDADNDTITYSATGLPSGATFTGQTFNWTPNYNQAGTYQVTFTASDGQAQDSPQTVNITVNNVNRAPVLAAIGDKSVNENSLLSFTVSATDADSDAITYSATGLPSGATFTGQTFSWTPDQAGTYQVTFTANDGQAQDSKTVNITVNNIITNIYEAEDAILSGSVASSAASGYTGTGFADYVNPSGDYVEWTVNVNTSGQYELQFRYALASGDRPLEIKVNGQVVASSLSFPATGSWTSWATVSTKATLKSGQNTIRATAIGSSGANVDNLKVISQ
jgi:hypothetical protein